MPMPLPKTFRDASGTKILDIFRNLCHDHGLSVVDGTRRLPRYRELACGIVIRSLFRSLVAAEALTPTG